MSNEQKTWYALNVSDARAGVAVLSIYDEIGGWGIGAGQFARDLAACGDVAEIELRLNSPGGSVIEGTAIYNVLRQHKARKVVYIDGWAASMASVVAMAGDEVHMPANTWLMIHNPWTVAMGGAEELRKNADLLDKMREQIIGAYQQHTELSRDEIAALMDAETWMTGEEAYEMGFATHCEDALEVAALVRAEAFPNARPFAVAVAPQEETKADATGTPDVTGESADAGAAEQIDPEVLAEAEEIASWDAAIVAAADEAYDEGYNAGEEHGAVIARADVAAKLTEAQAQAQALAAEVAALKEQAVAAAASVETERRAHADELAALKAINEQEVAALQGKLNKLLPATAFVPSADEAVGSGDYWQKVSELKAGGMPHNEAIEEARRRYPSLHAAMLRQANKRPSK